MKFGFVKYFLLAIIVIVGGGIGWFAFKDVPVQQQDISVNVPIGNNQ